MAAEPRPTRTALEALADELADGHGSGLLGVGATTAEDARELAAMVAERRGRGTT